MKQHFIPTAREYVRLPDGYLPVTGRARGHALVDVYVVPAGQENGPQPEREAVALFRQVWASENVSMHRQVQTMARGRVPQTRENVKVWEVYRVTNGRISRRLGADQKTLPAAVSLWARVERVPAR